MEANSQLRALNQLSPGESAIIAALECRGGIRRRLLDIGFINGTRVECVGQSPHGDPKAFLVRGAVMAIRSEDSRHILIREEQEIGIIR